MSLYNNPNVVSVNRQIEIGTDGSMQTELVATITLPIDAKDPNYNSSGFYEIVDQLNAEIKADSTIDRGRIQNKYR